MFVPGDRPDRIPKAIESGAAVIVVDLEDAVDATAKDSARKLAGQALEQIDTGSDGPAVFLRVNGLETGWAADDLAAASALAGRIAGIAVPKAETADELRGLAGGLPLLPIVETARGIMAAGQIARVPGVRAMAFGSIDLAAQLGVTPSIEGRELLHARSQLVLACAAAGLPGPIDGPHAALDDLDGLSRSSAAARELGFTGKIVLHPRQIETVRAAFAPSAAELAQARQIIDAYQHAGGTGAAKLPDGTFVDKPVVLRAASLLGIDLERESR